MVEWSGVLLGKSSHPKMKDFISAGFDDISAKCYLDKAELEEAASVQIVGMFP